MTIHEVPLFPLQSVLFPGTSLPLHIFEQRYREMVGRCLEDGSPFGVVLIKEGSEVGEPAVPHAVGTTARIVDTTVLPDGRMNIVTRGERRFRIVSMVREQPYMTALIEEITENDDREDPVDPTLISAVREAYVDCVRSLVALQGGWLGNVETPEDARELSYFVPGTAEFELITKQEILEIPLTSPRLERELEVLRRARARMRRDLGERNPISGVRLN